MKVICVNGNSLTLEDLVKVSRENYKVELAKEAIERVSKSREAVDEFVEEGKVIYGITTGFGKFSDVLISKDQTKELQRNLIVSDCCGVGKPYSEEIVRAAMLLRVNALAKGFSGIRLSTLNVLIKMLNKGVHPVVPEKGSVGASGDLCPLAHIVLVMLGEGEAFYQGKRMKGFEAMKDAGIETVELIAKEGLALINGTCVLTAVGALAAYDAKMVAKLSDISAAMTVEALNGIVDAYDKRVHEVRPHEGQINCAQNMLNLLAGSKSTTRQGEIRVQDAYTLRCIPQIHGASRDAIDYVIKKVTIELNSATDNPLIFSEDKEVISGGNFHGQPMALVFDFLSIAIAELANVAERRIERLVNPALSRLPAFLVKNGGLNDGLMIPQYVAAALVSENKVLAHPACVDSIPTCANQEDHVSMGSISARQSREILNNVMHVLGIELMTAAQAIEFGAKEKLGKGTKVAYAKVREYVEPVENDRVFHIDMHECYKLVASHELVKAVEEEIGELK
ncbi:histidine ammonia-lyase [Crassaminicella thermophila]|uniref:Histidine ammonia-lyase n=1 Tax=Crassaminicella thermophila TaxID=2599308 RepID=A0A5C0SDQ0_CRATE|nr:histidine ammonia-lyase [Crassaminicella thermophila]QEK11069.1 histidine ammonia-lyase [Crassaminicella thermophila]